MANPNVEKYHNTMHLCSKSFHETQSLQRINIFDQFNAATITVDFFIFFTEYQVQVFQNATSTSTKRSCFLKNPWCYALQFELLGNVDENIHTMDKIDGNRLIDGLSGVCLALVLTWVIYKKHF